jgi:Ankyrin repeats (3 copies)
MIERAMELIPLLLQYGANTAIKTQCASQMTPLHVCSLNPICIPMMKVLLESESTTVLSSSNDTDNDHSNHLINIQDNKGRTSLYYAIQARNIPAVKLLLLHPSINLQQKDILNLSPLHYAIIVSFCQNDEDHEIDEDLFYNACDMYTAPSLRIDYMNNVIIPSLNNMKKEDCIVHMIHMEHEERKRHQIRHQIYHDLLHSSVWMMTDQQQQQQKQQEEPHKKSKKNQGTTENEKLLPPKQLEDI